MHSYKVFDVRRSKDLPDFSDGAKVLDLKSGDITSVPTKPILMCFICKLSFGYAKSFISHSQTEHSMDLNTEERDYLSRKNASAIIQGIGKSKEPLMSFLEPVSPPMLSNKSGLNTELLSKIANYSTKVNAAMSTNATNVSFVYSGSKVSPVEQRSTVSDNKIAHTSSNRSGLPNSQYSSSSFKRQHEDKMDVDYDDDNVVYHGDDDDDDSLSSTDNLLSSSSSSLKSHRQSSLSLSSSMGSNPDRLSAVKRDAMAAAYHTNQQSISKQQSNQLFQLHQGETWQLAGEWGVIAGCLSWLTAVRISMGKESGQIFGYVVQGSK